MNEDISVKGKEESDQYASHSMDSDVETYDTEGLSMMDINDIIGVQSEPVNDSTLESEIDALSKIITDSKENEKLNTKDNCLQEKDNIKHEESSSLHLQKDASLEEKSLEGQPDIEHCSQSDINNSVNSEEKADIEVADESSTISEYESATSTDVLNQEDLNEVNMDDKVYAENVTASENIETAINENAISKEEPTVQTSELLSKEYKDTIFEDNTVSKNETAKLTDRIILEGIPVSKSNVQNSTISEDLILPTNKTNILVHDQAMCRITDVNLTECKDSEISVNDSVDIMSDTPTKEEAQNIIINSTLFEDKTEEPVDITLIVEDKQSSTLEESKVSISNLVSGNSDIAEEESIYTDKKTQDANTIKETESIINDNVEHTEVSKEIVAFVIDSVKNDESKTESLHIDAINPTDQNEMTPTNSTKSEISNETITNLENTPETSTENYIRHETTKNVKIDVEERNEKVNDNLIIDNKMAVQDNESVVPGKGESVSNIEMVQEETVKLSKINSKNTEKETDINISVIPTEETVTIESNKSTTLEDKFEHTTYDKNLAKEDDKRSAVEEEKTIEKESTVKEENNDVSVGSEKIHEVIANPSNLVMTGTEAISSDKEPETFIVDNSQVADKTVEITGQANMSEVTIQENSFQISFQENNFETITQKNEFEMTVQEDMSKITIQENTSEILMQESISNIPFPDNFSKINIEEKTTQIPIGENISTITLDENISGILLHETSSATLDNKLADSIENSTKMSTIESNKFEAPTEELETVTESMILQNSPESADANEMILNDALDDSITAIMCSESEENKVENSMGISKIMEDKIEETTDTLIPKDEISLEKDCVQFEETEKDGINDILAPVCSVPDLSEILDAEEEVTKETDVLPVVATLPLDEEDIDICTTKLETKMPETDEILNKELEEEIAVQNIESLEGLLELIPENDEAPLKPVDVENIVPNEQSKPENTNMENIDKDVDMSLLLEETPTAAMTQGEDYIEDVIDTCLSTVDETLEKTEGKDVMLIPESENAELASEKEIEGPDLDLTFEIENEQEPLESLENEPKLDLPQDLLFEESESTEILQPSSEITELESAVKFLQESEEQTIDSPLVLSPKVVENATTSEKADTELLTPVQETDLCEDESNLAQELQNIAPDPIAISEAEIISEAVKLESEKKAQLSEHVEEEKATKILEVQSGTKSEEGLLTVAIHEPKILVPLSTMEKSEQRSESVPQSSNVTVLEERLKEPPQIEIPITACEVPITAPSSTLLMPRDSKASSLQKSLDSPRKDNEPTENVGSPRIILKIAKSAIADCSEPRSPKSPKIRSAANSPNPEDSPGQKLGKIKLKLSKSGHPSIISNENVDESVTQWHADSSTSSLSPLGVKIKLLKTGDASVVQHELQDDKEKYKNEENRRIESPIGMKIKLSKTGDASVIQSEKHEGYEEKERSKIEEIRRIESPIGMKFKLSKSGDAEIIQDSKDAQKYREKHDSPQEPPKRTESPIGMKIKLSKSGDASIIQPDEHKDSMTKIKDRQEDIPRRTESPIGVKIKLSKTGDASIVEENKDSNVKGKEKLELSELPKRTESPLGMKIKLSKSGDATIVHPEKQEIIESEMKNKEKVDFPKRIESPIGMKIKLSKSGDASIIPSDMLEESNEKYEEMVKMKIKSTLTPERDILSRKEKSESRERRHKSKEPEGPLEMKIKVSKSGHATIVTNETYEESKEVEESPTKHIKSGNSAITSGDSSELTIEPVQFSSKKLQKYLQNRKQEPSIQITAKRKDTVIATVETKKAKLESKISQILPEVTIQPVTSKEQKQKYLVQSKASISQQSAQMSNQDLSITHIRPVKDTLPVPLSSQSIEMSMSEKFKNILHKQSAGSPAGSDCEIIEQRPELIIVNENSNSSQDVMIIEEVPVVKPVEVKVPKKRGRPRRTQIQPVTPQAIPDSMHMMLTRDPLALDEPNQQQPAAEQQRENERPRRTCRSQKSYAPPKRGRGRGGGRGKRKLDNNEVAGGKKPRIEQDLTAIEQNTTALITLDDVPSAAAEVFKVGLEHKIHVYKSPEERNIVAGIQMDGIEIIGTKSEAKKEKERLKNKDTSKILTPKMVKVSEERRVDEVIEIKDSEEKVGDGKGIMTMGSSIVAPQNWLTPISKKVSESTVQVIDEDTRMSAESGSRSQTPARNLPIPVSETIINEESQGSVLSTATTESEKVKVKNRRMEINFDPDEGPFTVDKIAEYEWPLDRKGETFMVQEQISQYLGVKSFKRKYPDLKRRMVDMEERNYLRENGLVSEAMCDMGLTAVCSSEVLDVMCSDFPEQYEEYRKHMREKQVKEHSKKQKELSAAANAERTRIDLAEMAVQSALSWNASLNKSRQETRKCSLDLQTFTIHVPQKKAVKIDSNRHVSHYPVALIPGQYTDFYREYTPAELRYYPLNTVLYGPMRPNERKFDSQSEGSQSDSDSDSSSDDSSSSSSEGTQDTEESQSTMDEVDMEIAHKDEIKNLKCKMCLKNLNKLSKSEVLIQCGTCNGYVHPSCIDLTLDMVPHIQAYSWQCTDCKTCAQCHDPADEDKMLFCDMCDRGYHIYCVGLRRVPQGRWHCQECAVCANCGSKEPGGPNADRNNVAQWQHEYKKGDKNIRVYVSTLCVPCSKLWRKGRYCPHCSRCHTAQRLDLETTLVHCSACDKYLHLGCVEIRGAQFDRKNYLCDFCSPSRASLPRSIVSKAFKSC